jgi:outer membrane protein assembly factor BamA
VHFKLGFNYRLFKNLQVETLGNGLIASDSFERLAESVFGDNQEKLLLGAGAGATYKTPLGPVSVFLAGNNQDSRLRWYINMGFTF